MTGMEITNTNDDVAEPGETDYRVGSLADLLRYVKIHEFMLRILERQVAVGNVHGNAWD